MNFLFAPNSTAVCNHWAYNAFKSSVVFSKAKQGLTAAVTYETVVHEMRTLKQRQAAKSNRATNNNVQARIVID